VRQAANLRPGGSVSLQATTTTFSPRPTYALIVIGASRTRFGPIALPLDLTRFGAGGNHLYVSMDVVVSVTPIQTHISLDARLTIPIPNQRSLEGAQLFAQSIYPHAPSNALGLVYSNAAYAIIGCQQPAGQYLIGAKNDRIGKLPNVMTHLVIQLHGTSFQ